MDLAILHLILASRAGFCIPGTCRTLRDTAGHLRDTCGKPAGHLCGTPAGHLQDTGGICRNCAEHLRDTCGHLRDTSGTPAGHLWDTCGMLGGRLRDTCQDMLKFYQSIYFYLTAPIHDIETGPWQLRMTPTGTGPSRNPARTAHD